MNKVLQHYTKPSWLPFLVLAAFSGAALYLGMYMTAAVGAAAIIVLLIVSLISWRSRTNSLAAFLESVLYDAETAKSSTLMSFPLPIAIFALEDSRIIWGNAAFFDMCGEVGTRLDANLAQLVPQFSGKWLLEGKSCYPSLLEIQGRKYRLHGSIVHSEQEPPAENRPIMGITYWVDVTDYDNIRIAFEDTRPVAGVIVIDNLDELIKNVPDRVKNDLRDAIEDKLSQWTAAFQGIFRRYDRDRYLLLMEHQAMERLKPGKFSIVEDIHSVVNPFGIAASISIGLGADCETLTDALAAADNAAELALSRGGDQTVIKSHTGFDFFGGRGGEVESRAKVRSRSMANALASLIRDSSRLYVMGHRFGDMDSFGASVGICAVARLLGIRCEIVADLQHTAAGPLADRVLAEEAYRDVILDPAGLPAHIDPAALLVVVDTSRPEQVEVASLLKDCRRVAVIDHHRVAATYIQDPAFSFIEPFASSACELVAGMLQDLPELNSLLPCEAEALLAGIVLDTKNFSLRTGERTFDAAAWLRRSGADTASVKRLFQSDLDHMVAKSRILEQTELYRQIAIAVPQEPQDRVVAAMAADELLNIAGVAASIVLAPDGRGGCFASARSLGSLNVQLIMEKLGGGGNANAAAMQMSNTSAEEALRKVYDAINDYMNDDKEKQKQ